MTFILPGNLNGVELEADMIREVMGQVFFKLNLNVYSATFISHLEESGKWITLVKMEVSPGTDNFNNGAMMASMVINKLNELTLEMKK